MKMEENKIPTGTDRQSCVLCGSLCNEATDTIRSTQRWENIKQKALLWNGLDKFGHVYPTVDWDKGPVGRKRKKKKSPWGLLGPWGPFLKGP